MQMAQYQVRLDIEDAELMNVEAELVNSLMQYEHHGKSSHHGSVMGRSFVQHDREECHDRMMKDYFIERPRFPAHDFRRLFRMRRELFESILNAIVNHDHYFARKIDVVDHQSLSPHQKFTFAFRMLANGCSADLTNEYCRIAESTTIEKLKCLCQAIQAIYEATYLRKPNRKDLKRLLRKADKRGFLGMIGSLDCMHWECNSRAVITNQPSCSRLWHLTTRGFGMHSSALLDQTTISTFFGLLLCSIML
ncbi:uncharacterized protein [Pyrus communis]|uniref:uncharacterized protein n=1 Tax=Pyrus communis TaxID=23211 RepID=UPI0035C1F8E1